MMVYAVIDTNVLVSALYTSNEKAATARLIRALGNGNFHTLYNDEIIKEYQEVLHRVKFNFDSELADTLIETVISNGIPANRIASGEQFPDPDDAVFYEGRKRVLLSSLAISSIFHTSPLSLPLLKCWRY